MITVISGIVVFLLLITVHEFGHFIVAKAVGAKVYQFAIGMGPVLLRWGKGETEYSLRLLPIGGFCELGEDQETSDDPNTFNRKPAWARFLILAAGGFMNLVLGFLALLLFTASIQTTAVPVIDTVIEESAAEEAGLMPGDRFVEIEGRNIYLYEDLVMQLSRQEPDMPIDLTVEREDEEMKVTLTPRYSEEAQRYLIGFQAKTEELTFGGRIAYAWHYTFFLGRMVIDSLLDLITGRVKMDMMMGPVGVVSEIGAAAKLGFPYLLMMIGLISVNLGIFNLLPLPALDGGRILFVVIEWITRRKIPPEKEGIVHLAGFALLLLLMLFVTYQDIVRLVAK